MFSSRLPVNGHWVAVMRHRRDERNMTPAVWQTRCVRSGEVHELILCRRGLPRGEPINDVSYLGFAEFSTAGVIAVGDRFWAGERTIGTLHAFDDTHMPNHFNIVVSTEELVTGSELGLLPGEPCGFRAA